MKKHFLLSILLVLLLCLLGISLSACNLFEDSDDSSGFSFIETDIGGYGLKQYYGDSKDVVIPSTYNDEPITLIYSIAFPIYNHSSAITSIEIPASIKQIQNGAFEYCFGLDTVYYTGTLSEWCNIKFGGDTASPMIHAHHLYINGEEVTGDLQIPDDVYEINPYAFYGVERLTSITMSDNTTSIGAHAFRGNPYLQNVDIGNGVTFIGVSAFENCTNLTTLNLGNSVETIADRAFSSNNIQQLDIPESVKAIGISAFGGNSEMHTLTIRCKTLIAYDCFVACKALQYVNYIGDFKDWLNFEFNSYSSNPMYYSKKMYVNGELLQNILTIPDGTININKYSLIYFEDLTSLILPDSLKKISTQAFAYCNNLNNMYFKGTEQQWAAIEFGISNSNPLPHVSKSFFSEDNPYENGTASKYTHYWYYNEYQQPQEWIK